MKKTLFSLLTLLVLCSAMAQHRQKFGITAGMNYSKFRGMDLPQTDYSYAPGLAIGFAYEYYLNEQLSIKANLFYENKKSKAEADFQLRQEIDEPIQSFTETVTYSYNYITLPVMVKYDFKGGKGFFINGGFFTGYLLDSELKGEGNTSAIPGLDFTQSTTEYNNKFDCGFVLGVGKAFRLNEKNSLVLELRNSHGLFQTNKNNTFDGNTVRSNSYALLLGWSCNL